ncbi:hypothetical protein [Actinoplanes regularis]|uniref:Uncharacterized protein n=1 Tax=Actinoplanes regularis TaxID=52697 RepID=A0A239IVA8_9ACTN|nr:hypothetical protein [Actinoplanes regularis]GIE91589.1 hypothetical protein Are01nite_80690 [Actinoplanes regularis]SNS97537.1 hypothetical protein SAMN06264365_13128 [Actinoplanes regularis]
MHPSARAALRHFPLIGRPRPACPSLPERIKVVTDAVQAAAEKAEGGMHDAAHALNKAALIASDGGHPDLARQLCWQHINAYRQIGRQLTYLEARYLLEPVHNLARQQIRADHGSPALRLLEAMHRAITGNRNLVVDTRTLPTADLTGDRRDKEMLHRWIWLQLVGDGVRALALGDRWTQAADHARRHNGVGDHLLEGRQAAIIAHIIDGDRDQGRELLSRSTPTEPWERDVIPCLHAVIADLHAGTAAQHLDTAAARYRATPNTGRPSYRAQFGLTIATLATALEPEKGIDILGLVADEAVASADGYAARDVAKHSSAASGLTDQQAKQLNELAAESGLGFDAFPGSAQRELVSAAREATHRLAFALKVHNQHP